MGLFIILFFWNSSINLMLTIINHNITGPTLYTLCTAIIDLDERTLAITEVNPKKGEVSHVLTMA